MKKNGGNGRRGVKRRKNEEKRARRVREKVRERARERAERCRLQDVLADRVTRAAKLSRVGVATCKKPSSWFCNKDGIGRLRYETEDFVLERSWRELSRWDLQGLEREKFVPYLPKSPLERLAECSQEGV